MIEPIREWYQRNFSDPQAVILALLLISAFMLIWLLGDILAPVMIALVFAYLLDGVVTMMQRYHIPRPLAAAIVMMVFVFFCLLLLFGVMPLLSQQVTSLIRELPNMIAAGQQQLQRLPELYPAIFTAEQINEVIGNVRSQVGQLGQKFLSYSIASALNLFALAIYVVLVPLIVFFALKDKKVLLEWAHGFMPRKSQLAEKVWEQADGKIANYIRGKVIEIMIVWLVTYVTFAVMDLNYAVLLSFMVGISVIIPFVGAVVVTLPIAIIAYFQWGFSAKFGYLLASYQVIQILDGNVLVPLLFSEVVDLHPLAIIVSVLFFGGLWGLWGVFFAIPLAALIQAVLEAWPRHRGGSMDSDDETSLDPETEQAA
ncbi:AI-2E family transporter [Chromatiales bacterium (ex Bugula neritina AB1)]|nr:AI-2E family transporter [Chromatiales bacterium (ex Bugula neritina AB1)]